MRFWLWCLVAACILPGMVAATFLIVRSYERERASLEVGVTNTARALMQAVDEQIGVTEAVLQGLALSPSLEGKDFASFHGEARRLLTVQGSAISIFLSDPSGQMLVNTFVPYGEPLPPGKPIWSSFRRVLETGKPAVADIFMGPIAQALLLAVEVPVLIDGKIAYVIGMALYPDKFGKILQRQKVPPDWIISILDSTGTSVARTHSPDKFVGKKAAPAALSRMAEVPEGTLSTPTVEGIPVFAAFSTSSLTGWRVLIGVPSASLTGNLRESLYWLLASAAALLIAVVLAASSISRRFVRSIHAVAGQASALAAGKPLSIPRTEILEMAEIANALEGASHLLAQREAAHETAEAAERKAIVADRVAARFSGLLDATPDAMVVVRRDGRISLANNKVEAVFGYARTEILDQPVEVLVPEGLTALQAHSASQFFEHPTAGARGTGLSLVGRRKDGTEFPAELSLSPIEADGEQLVMAAIRDVSDRKRLEADVEAGRMQVLASARLSAIGTMAGGIAHEINNPLAIIHAAARDLVETAEQADFERDEALRAARHISKNSERIAVIVKSLRHIARDGGNDPFTEASVNEIVEHALAISAERFRQHSIDLLTMPIDPDLRVTCREVQISQILTNLLQNAFDAVQEQSGKMWVRLEIAIQEQSLVFSVIDSGSGVPPEVKALIMEAFFTTKPVGKGTGLGLSVSKQIAEEHGGTLEYGERDGHTCFSLRLPLSRGETPCS